MSDQERTRADSSDEIGDSRQDHSDENTGSERESRSAGDSQMDASRRNQHSAADDLDDASRERRGDGFGEVY